MGSYVGQKCLAPPQQVHHLMEKCGQLDPPFLMPGGTVAQVHHVLHLLHCFDGGHLKMTAATQILEIFELVNMQTNPAQSSKPAAR